MPAFFRIFILGLLTFSAFAATESRYAPGVVSILQSHDYIRQHAAPIYWKISPYYISQRNDRSCSLATATMIVNAARSDQNVSSDQLLATQDSLLKRVNDKNWDERVGVNGNGVTLDQLKPLLAKALSVYGLHDFTIDVVHIQNNSKETASRLHHALMENEIKNQSLIVANFNYKFFTRGAEVGHFAPVGAYDPQTKRVLIMDPYRKLYEPYWVPETLFLDGMATQDSESKQYRGYLLIKFKSDKSPLQAIGWC